MTGTSYHEGGVFADCDQGFPSAQSVNRAELISLRVHHEMWVVGHGVWQNVGSESGSVSVWWDESLGASSPGDHWGPFDPGGTSSTVTSPAVLPNQLVTQSFSTVASLTGSTLYTPNHFVWFWILAVPELRIYASMSNVRWDGMSASGGASVEFRRMSMLIDAYARVEFEATIELAAFPAVSLCTSRRTRRGRPRRSRATDLRRLETTG